MISTRIYNPRYIERTEQTFNRAINQYPRLATFRFDLRFPANGEGRCNEYAISHFFDSLKYQITALFRDKQKAGITCDHPTSLRYIWCREYGQQKGNRHYHVMLLVNKDTFHVLGDYLPHEEGKFCSLANLIQKAWCSTLQLSWKQFFPLVSFPGNPCIWIERNKSVYSGQYGDAWNRAMYLCKEATKHYGDGRSFGYSQPDPSVIGRRRKTG